MFWNIPAVAPSDNAPMYERIFYMGKRTGTTTITQTITAVDIGAADEDRVVAVVIASWRSSTGLPSISSVTIGGIAATLVDWSAISGSIKGLLIVGYAAVPTGTSVNVGIVGTGSLNDAIDMGIYRILTPTPAAADVDLSAMSTEATKSLTLTGGGVGLWATCGWSTGPNFSDAANAERDTQLNEVRNRQQNCGRILNPASSFSVTMSSSPQTWRLGGICWE